MSASTRLRRSFALAAVIALPFTLAACSDSEPEATTSAPTTAAAAAPATEEVMADGPFGPGCAAVPASGAGSFDGMSTEPVATAASNNPLLSTLVTAVTAAELADTLNTTEGITVFAPTNDAFAAMDPATLQAALDDPKGLLTAVLTNHVVAGELSPDMLAGEHTTLGGGTITVEGSGEDFTVGEAAVICGDVETANATVYIIDGVLLPAA